jgi:hypothetical protein
MRITTLRSKSLINGALWGIVTVLALNLGWSVYKSSLSIQVHAAASGYTVVRTEKGFDAAGTLRYTNEHTEAVRGDGARMWSVSTPIERQRRIGFPDGSGVLINELSGKKSTYPKEFTALPIQRDPNNACASQFDLNMGIQFEGTDDISGYKSLRFGHTSGKRYWKGWYVQELGCALVKSRLEHESGVTVQDLSSLTVAEPNPSLFQVSASLIETPPSGVYGQDCGGNSPCASLPDAVRERLDNRYYKTQGR